MSNLPGTLLCIANWSANVGYAWNSIEGLYARVADRLATQQVQTMVAYPRIATPPRALKGSAARAIELDGSLTSLGSLRQVARVIRAEDVKVVYLTDRRGISWAYAPLRSAGVQRIIVHARVAGTLTPPVGVKRAIRRLGTGMPRMTADMIIGVSEYVVRHRLITELLPPARVIRIANSVAVPVDDYFKSRYAHRALNLDPSRILVACTCRASLEKGLIHLLRAFELVWLRSRSTKSPPPILVFVGDGPQLTELEQLRATLNSREDIVFPGQRLDAAHIAGGSDLCVVPSVCQEAFCLAALEAMAHGRPVVATRVGGIPELVQDGRTGILVAPANEQALADAIARVLDDPSAAREMGRAGRRRAERYSPDTQIDRLVDVLCEGFPSVRRAGEPATHSGESSAANAGRAANQGLSKR